MSETTLTLDTKEWDTFLRSISTRAADASRYLIAVGSTFGFKDIIKHFSDESGPQGKWKRRASSTQAYYQAVLSGKRKPSAGTARAAYNPSNKVLQLTGRLRQSLLPGRGGIEKIDKQSVMIFTNVEYAGTHDRGDSGRGIPKREFMWLDEDTQQRMADALLDMVLEGL